MMDQLPSNAPLLVSYLIGMLAIHGGLSPVRGGIAAQAKKG